MTDAAVDPEDVFGVLGNETRIAILRVLGEADEALSFSALHDRVGTRDSGQFNYHLKQLLDSFVRRTDAGAYELSYAGGRVIGAIQSGEFSRSDSRDPFALDSTCANCGTQLEARYEDETVSIDCPGCEEVDTGFGFPPGGIADRDSEVLTRVFDRWLRSVFSLIAAGICNNCTGTLVPTVTDESAFIHPDDPACVEFACERCPDVSTMSLSSYLYLLPAVREFYHDHGVDLSTVEMWNARTFVDPIYIVHDTDPWAVDARFELEDETLTVHIDEAGTATVKAT